MAGSDVAGNLVAVRGRVELLLQDVGNVTWATGDLDEAIQEALERYAKVNPAREIATVVLAADGREIDISAIVSYLTIERVWWDYDAADPRHPPRWRDFELWSGDVLYINDAEEPQIADVVRLWLTKKQVLDTTVADGVDGVANGTATFTSAAGAFAATMIGDDIEIVTRGVYMVGAVAAANSLTLIDPNALGWPAAGVGLTYAIYDESTASTLPADDESLIVTGAAGIAAIMRSREVGELLSVDGWVPRRAVEWGEARVVEFEAGLSRIAAQIASRASGIAGVPVLDRWEGDGSGWW